MTSSIPMRLANEVQMIRWIESLRYMRREDLLVIQAKLEHAIQYGNRVISSKCYYLNNDQVEELYAAVIASKTRYDWSVVEDLNIL